MNESSSQSKDAPPGPMLFPRALACFLISALSLAWMISLQLQSASHALIVSRPRPRVTVEPAPRSEPPPAPPAAPRLASAPRELSEADVALSEIELIHNLLAADSSLNYRSAASMLRVHTLSKNAAVREAATRELSEILAAHDKSVSASMSAVIARVRTWSEKGDYGAAVALLQKTLDNLPEDSAWTENGPDKILRAQIVELTKKGEAERAAVLGGLEDALRKKDAGADERLAAALKHPDSTIREQAQALSAQVRLDADKAQVAQRTAVRAAREDWMKFFRRFSATIAEGDFGAAQELCEQPPFETILKAGVPDPDKVFRSSAEDVRNVQNLYDEALKDAKGLHKQVSFHLRKGGQAAGTLMGVNGRQLRINPGKGGELGVKIGDLTSEGVKALLDSGARKQKSVRLALASLEAHESPADAETIVSEAYEKEHEPVPAHWSERFKLDRDLKAVHKGDESLAKLKATVKGDDADAVKGALEEVKNVLALLNENGSIDEDARATLAKAQKLAASKELSTVELQNGRAPDAAYRGINTDQISEYRDLARRTDVGVGNGLKLGASGGLQRVLIKIEGIEAAVGKGRVRKATLQLYQIDSPKFKGATVGAFRLKRAWIPDAGSWLSYDGKKEHDWALPGASGEGDIEPKEDAKVTLGNRSGQWQSWDVTRYVQDVLGGKTQDNGLLLKIINGEPEYHARFYPETDLERAKDAALRPKLVLEVTRDAE